MSKNKSIGLHGLKGSQRESARLVDDIFNQSERSRSIVRANASMNLTDFPDEKCAWCAKLFDAKKVVHKYCCKECLIASNRAVVSGARAAERARLVCVWCGAPIVGAKRGTRKYCSPGCRAEANYERFQGWRAEVRVRLTCVDCGALIAGAMRVGKTLCAACRRKHRLANCKANRERTKAGTNGKRGTNQFQRVG